MRHISVSLRRATKAETEVHELQNYRHARHNLKSYSAENKYISTERSVTASLHPHFDAAKLQIFSDTSKSPPSCGIKNKDCQIYLQSLCYSDNKRLLKLSPTSKA